MTKTTTKLDPANIVGAEAAAPAAVVQKPLTVSVFGPATTALQKAAVLIRAGYTPCLGTPVEIFAAAGTISLTLILGTPQEEFVAAAAVDIADAAAREQARYLADVERAAARQIEQTAKAAAESKRAALIAQHREALRKIELEIEAA